MKRRMWTAAAVCLMACGLVSVGGCGEPEPAIGQSHHTQPGESARFDALRGHADEKSPFTGKTERPHEANARDMEANGADADFHARAEETSPLTHSPTR